MGMRGIKTKEKISFIQQENPTPDFLPTTSHEMLPKTALQDKEASPALPSRKLLVQKKRTVQIVSSENRSLWDALLQRVGAGGGNGEVLVSVALS